MYIPEESRWAGKHHVLHDAFPSTATCRGLIFFIHLKIFYSIICVLNGKLKFYEFAMNILILVISPNWWDGGVALQQGLIISQIRGVALPHGQHPTATGLPSLKEIVEFLIIAYFWATCQFWVRIESWP